MGYKPGDAYVKEFVTASPTTGAAQNADSLPVATANRNGADDATFALVVSNIDAGRYKATGTIPAGYASGDVLNISVAATVGGVGGKAVVDTRLLDANRTGEVYARIGAAGAGLTAVTLADASVTSAKFSVAGYTGPATGLLERIDQLWRRFFKRSAKAVSGATIRTYADDGTTVLTTQAWTDDGAGNETLGASA